MNRTSKIALGGLAAGTLFAGAAAGLAAVVVGKRLLRYARGHADDLYGQTVVITGGSRGLGLALAEEFARHGCRIVICARDEDELVRARTQIERLGTEVLIVPCDVSRQEEAENLVQQAQQRFGAIDILVNNAGIISVGPLLSQRIEDFREAMDVMFWGASCTSRRLAARSASRICCRMAAPSLPASVSRKACMPR